MEPPATPPPAHGDGPPRSPPDLRPPQASAAPVPRGGWTARAGLAVLVAALLLVAVGVVVLPGLLTYEPGPSTPQPMQARQPPPAVAATTQPKTAEPPTTSAATRREAEQALQRYLRQRAELELAGAEAWAGDEMAQAAAGAADGDRLFGQRRFDDAVVAYGTAAERLDALLASRPQRLAKALEEGVRALAADDAAAATAGFEMALAIEPGHEQATRGLARAVARPELLRKMTDGKLAEASGDLAAARDAYLAAAALDADYPAAGEAAQRVAGMIADRAFGAAMSGALAALDAGRFKAAASDLETAARLRPGDRAVTDARRRLAAARQAAELDRLRRAAAEKVTAEAWSEAVVLYRQALKVDSTATFARAGLERAEPRARLHERIDHFLADPARLHSPGPLDEAGRLLAAPAPGSEPRLAAKVERLGRLVAAARAPRAVTLRSDGLTEVTVYHVGRLGAFVEQRLELRPGTYTAVGARPGYRDVRVRFTVAADAPLAAVDIRCTEAL